MITESVWLGYKPALYMVYADAALQQPISPLPLDWTRTHNMLRAMALRLTSLYTEVWVYNSDYDEVTQIRLEHPTYVHYNTNRQTVFVVRWHTMHEQ